MGRKNIFEEIYLQNKEEITKDAENMTQLDFMKKYHIGTNTYYTYFRGISKYVEIRMNVRSQERQEERQRRHEQIKNRYHKRLYDDRTWYESRVKTIAYRLWVTVQKIKELSNDYTISEIENAEKINGKIVCSDEVKMTLPKSIQESVCSYQCWMV